MTDVALSTVFSNQRRQIVTRTASDAAIAIPTWAQGGKGIMYVTGCGGGSGSNNTSNGAAAASAMAHPLIIPSGATTVSVTIGAAGDNTGINNGGNTDIAFGSTNVLRLGGGSSSTNYPYFWGGSAWVQCTAPTGAVTTSDLSTYSAFRLMRGRNGGDGPFGARGSSAHVNAAGYGTGSGPGGNGAPGFLILEFVEGI